MATQVLAFKHMICILWMGGTLGFFGLTLPAWATTSPMAILRNATGEVFVIRTDGIEERFQGKREFPMFEENQVITESNSLALLTLDSKIQITLNEYTEILLLSRWERDKGFTSILRLEQRELWIKADHGHRPLEVETPVAIASIGGTELAIHVGPYGDTTLTVMEGKVEFGNALNTWSVPGGTFSKSKRGEKCTPPQHIKSNFPSDWTKPIRP